MSSFKPTFNGHHFALAKWVLLCVRVLFVCMCVSPVALVPPLRIVDLGDVETAVTQQGCVGVWV